MRPLRRGVRSLRCRQPLPAPGCRPQSPRPELVPTARRGAGGPGARAHSAQASRAQKLPQRCFLGRAARPILSTGWCPAFPPPRGIWTGRAGSRGRGSAVVVVVGRWAPGSLGKHVSPCARWGPTARGWERRGTQTQRSKWAAEPSARAVAASPVGDM